jgi:molybdate transport system substrate-binding protein
MKSRRAFIANSLIAASVSCGGPDAHSTDGGLTRTGAIGTVATAPASFVALTPTPTAEPKQVVVFAASSLATVVELLWKAFTAQVGNAGLTLTPNYGASSQLRTQLQEGAKADIFASADIAQMDLTTKARLVDGEYRVFARNRLVVTLPKGNPGKVTTLADLAKPGLKVVTAPADVPIGSYTRTALKKLAADPLYGDNFDTKVLTNVVSEEPNVRQVLLKVQLGEADVGICYATDVVAVPAGDVMTIEIPEAANVLAEYPIAVLKSAVAPATARRLITFILSPSGQSILATAMFMPA